MSRRRSLDGSLLARVPIVGALARVFAGVAARRAGRVPIGLLSLLPVAILLDAFDALDELALGPLGVAASFVLETAFLLGITGRSGYALGLAGLDVLPIVDTLPWATLTLLAEVARAWQQPTARPTPRGPIIDV